MFWVTMTDRFMSGWGRADGLTNKYIVECNTYKMAEQIKKAAQARPEMKYVNICTNKPHYNKKYYLESHKKASDLGTIWTNGMKDE